MRLKMRYDDNNIVGCVSNISDKKAQAGGLRQWGINVLVFISFFLFLCNLQTESQGLGVPSLDSLYLQQLIIKKNEDCGINKHKNKFSFSISYDFNDSISVFIDEKKIYNGTLKYLLPDTTSTLYPYNRVLLSFSRRNIISKHPECKICFWWSRRIIRFRLTPQAEFYILEILKDKKLWYLRLANAYPWPD